MAAVTALTTTSITAFADNENSEAIAAAITTAKSRISIPDELSEFSYRVSTQNLKTVYRLSWNTPGSAANYKSATVTVCGDMILDYYSSDSWKYGDEKTLAKLTGDRLYKKAKALVKQLDPSIANVIDIDRDSLNIRLYGNSASFSLVRMKNGIPVSNDSGTITLDKDTGELLAFSINWHPNASFQSADNAISEAEAKEKYAEMISIKPQYEFDYDWQTGLVTPRIVYRQTDYGNINAFTGSKSDFTADGYYDDEYETTEAAADVADGGNPETGSYTPAETEEITKNLPYGNKDAVIKLLKSNEWLVYNDDMELSYSYLYRTDTNGSKSYFYQVTFTNENWDENWDEYDYAKYSSLSSSEETADIISVSLTVNAETGEIINYSCYDDNKSGTAYSYDEQKAEELSKQIAASFAGDKFVEYQDFTGYVHEWENSDGITVYSGGTYDWDRYANDIIVSGDSISLSLDKDMRLTSYRINYTDIALPSPDGILTEKQLMKKFWQDNDLNLYYLAKVNRKKTKTVLVYGTDNTVYADAFTGEPIYSWQRSSEKNDLSGITDKKVLKMAQKLSDHGMLISSEKFSENDPVTYGIFGNLMGVSVDSSDTDRLLTRSAALIIFTRSVTSVKVARIKGIYKSPFSDISDDNPRVGYYAIAYGMGAFTESKLDPTASFTYGDMIKMVYTLYTND